MVGASVGVHCDFEKLPDNPGPTLGLSESKPLRRSNVGKSLVEPENFGSQSPGEMSVTGRSADDSVSTGSDPPSAFSLADLLCPAWKYRALSAHRHYPLSASTGLERPVFPCVLACENFKAQSEKGKLGRAQNTPPTRVKLQLCAGLPLRERDVKVAP